MLSVIFIVIVCCFRQDMAIIYTGQNESTPIVATGLLIYCTNIFPTFILYSQGSLLRYLNRNNLSVQVTAIIMPIFVFIFSGYLAFYGGMGALGLIWGFFGSKFIAVATFTLVIYNIDWEKGYFQYVKKNNT